MPIAEEVIRVRAYFLSLERSAETADPMRDWLEAERELGSADRRQPTAPARRGRL